MAADIIAVGPFGPEVASFLGYPIEVFAGTRPGAPVVAELFGITHGSTASRAFALTLGISDPWDFNQHKINPAAIDIAALRAFLGTLQDGEDFLPDVDGLIAMMKNGFAFYFRPNG